MKPNEIPVKARALLDFMIQNQCVTVRQMFQLARDSGDDFDTYCHACTLVQLYHLALMHGYSTMHMQRHYEDAAGFIAARAERLANHVN